MPVLETGSSILKKPMYVTVLEYNSAKFLSIQCTCKIQIVHHSTIPEKIKAITSTFEFTNISNAERYMQWFLYFWYLHKITVTYMRSVFFNKSLSRANNSAIHLAINILPRLSLFLPLYCLIRSTL